jgi:hypothetical protein
MTRKSVALSVLFLMFFCQFAGKINASTAKVSSEIITAEAKAIARQQFNKNLLALYDECGLKGKLSYDAFRSAMTGYVNMRSQGLLNNNNVISIIDFQKPSTHKRLFVIDLAARKILFNTYTSHGKNTGDNIATDFSNVPESNKSSVGFYVTAETYLGKHGYSLRLEGKDASFNNNARRRAIVVHGADYVSEKFIKTYGRLGRSQGCPALPQEISKDIIDTIKDGSLLFVYHNDNKYLTSSKYLDSDAAIMHHILLAAAPGPAKEV